MRKTIQFHDHEVNDRDYKWDCLISKSHFITSHKCHPIYVGNLNVVKPGRFIQVFSTTGPYHS